MRNLARQTLLFLASLLSCVLPAQDSNSPVKSEILQLRALPAPQRQAATARILQEIRSMKSGPTKLLMEFGLTQLVTGYDVSAETLKDIAQTYHQTLLEAPPENLSERAQQYEYLATFMHYQNVEIDLGDPELGKAQAVLVANDADVRKVDFTLSDMTGTPVTLSHLHGKIVLVNFWAAWCVPCLQEMHDLDAIHERYGSRKMTILSLTSDEQSKVATLLEKEHYGQQLLLDSEGTVSKKFHVSEIPHVFVFDRNGRFVVDCIGQHSQAQLMDMLHRSALLPEPK